MAKTPVTAPTLIEAIEETALGRALAALKPFAHLPISDDQPDGAHPAFQVQVAFVRAARELFPEDFAPVSASEPSEGSKGSTGPGKAEKGAGGSETGPAGDDKA